MDDQFLGVSDVSNALYTRKEKSTMPEMDNPDQLYTAGLWTVKPGKEVDFMRAWEEFARWTREHQPGAAEAYLVQDVAHPQRFLSFGPWESAESIDAWRATPEFKAFAAHARELCDDFQPGTFKLVAQV